MLAKSNRFSTIRKTSQKSSRQLTNPKGKAMLTIEEGITEAHLKDVYSDEYIVSRIGYDQRPPSPVVHPLATYLTAKIGGAFAGAFLMIRYSVYEFEMHSLLKLYAVKQSRELGRMALAWCFAHSDVLRVTAHIIEGLEKAVNYAQKIGFKPEGIRRDACKVDGVNRAVYLLGITRAELGEV